MLECAGGTATSKYRVAVATLRGMFVYHGDHRRPIRKAKLAPFDQASQKVVFPAGSDKGSPEQFLAWARMRTHPEDEAAPTLPDDLEAAVQYVWGMGSGVVADRAARMSVFDSISTSLEAMSTHLGGMMCDNAKAVARAMALNVARRKRPEATLDDTTGSMLAPHFALWCACLDAMQWPDVRLVADMIHGSPAVGDVPDSGLFRAVEKPASKEFGAFKAGNVAWMRECKGRVLARGNREPEMAKACWERTMEECGAGLVQGPFTISEIEQSVSSGFPAFGFGRCRPLPRFAVWQPPAIEGKDGKYRCIDDAAVSGTNGEGTTTHETIGCDKPDSPLCIGCRFHELGPPPREPHLRVEMGGGTDDAFAAYRRIVTRDGEYTVIMLYVPRGALGVNSPACVRLFRVPGNNFGLVSAVLNFNRVPEATVAISRRLFGTPVTRFYDDHQTSEPSYARGSGQAAHFTMHECLRFHFDIGKHAPWARSMVYCGVQTDWGRQAEGFAMVGVTQRRRRRVALIAREALANDVLTPRDANKLRAKARWCVAPVFGRIGAAVCNLLRDRQVCGACEDDDKAWSLDEELRQSLELLAVAVVALPDFCVRFRKQPLPQVVILSDASWSTGHKWLGYLVCCPIHGAVWAGGPTPVWVLDLWQGHKMRETCIGQCEAVIVASPYISIPGLRDRNVMHYIDNQGACYAFINGGAKDCDTNRCVFVTGMRQATLGCKVWYDYVPSASNIADLPTRLDDAAAVRLNKIARWVPLSILPEWCLSCAHDELTRLFV